MNGSSRALHYPGYALSSLIWLGLAWLGSGLLADRPLWAALLMTPVLGAPLLFAGLHGATVRRIRRSSVFAASGVLRRLATGRILISVFWVLWSLGSAFFMLLYLRSAAPVEWLALLAAIPLFALLVQGLLRPAKKELKPYIGLHASLAGSRWSLAVLMAIVQIGLASSMAAPDTTGLADAIAETIAASPPATTDSVLIQEAVYTMDWYRGLKLYALNHLRTLSDAGYLALVFAGSVAFYFNLGLALSAFIIPWDEYRRIVSPVIEVDIPDRISGRTLAITVAVGTFITLFVYLPLIAYLELWASTHTARIDDLRNVQQRVVTQVELIEGHYYQNGTIEQIIELRTSTLARMEPGVAAISRDSDLGYQMMAANVDSYLDWYYSLPAEYGRILALLSGNIEELLAEQLQQHLTRGNPFGNLEQSIASALGRQQELQRAYSDAVERILVANEWHNPADTRFMVGRRMSLSAVTTAPTHTSLTSLEGRLLTSGAAGAAITGLVATKITAKIIGKGTIKLGAKALAKVAAGKASSVLGGGTAGAVAGAAAGSVVPGIGTVIGGAIGGIVGGIAVGISVEALLLHLEEALSREVFKAELLQAIEESRQEFKHRLSAVASVAAKQNAPQQGLQIEEKDTQLKP